MLKTASGFKEPLIKSFPDIEDVVSTHLSDGFPSVGNDGCALISGSLSLSKKQFQVTKFLYHCCSAAKEYHLIS